MKKRVNLKNQVFEIDKAGKFENLFFLSKNLVFLSKNLVFLEKPVFLYNKT